MNSTIYNFHRGDFVYIARQIEASDVDSISWAEAMDRAFKEHTPGVIIKLHYHDEEPLIPFAVCVLFQDSYMQIDYWNFLIECIELEYNPDIIEKAQDLLIHLNNYEE